MERLSILFSTHQRARHPVGIYSIRAGVGKGRGIPLQSSPVQLQHILCSPISIHCLPSLDTTSPRKPSQTSPTSPSVSIHGND